MKENERTDRTRLGRSASKRFKAMLRAMTGKRGEVARCMAFALEHGEAAPEVGIVLLVAKDWLIDYFQVANIIVNSLVVDSTAVPRKMARLWLISDILHNSAVPLPHAWKYRQEFQQRLGVVFDHFSAIYHSFEGRLKADTFKRQVLAVVEVWDDWIVFPPEQTSLWKDRLEGKAVVKEQVMQQVQVVQAPVAPVVSKFKSSAFKPVVPDLPLEDAEADMDLDESDGEISAMPAPVAATVASEVVEVVASVAAPVADEDLDGAPIDDVDGESLEDVDGEPLDDLDGEPIGEVDGRPLDEEDLDGAPFDEEDIDGAFYVD
jgi:U2-associated protein SR140